MLFDSFLFSNHFANCEYNSLGEACNLAYRTSSLDEQNIPVLLFKMKSVFFTVGKVFFCVFFLIFSSITAAWKIIKSWLSPEAVNKIRYELTIIKLLLNPLRLVGYQISTILAFRLVCHLPANPISLPYSISPFHALILCHFNIPLQHVPISRPCNMSSFHIPVTCPHFRPCNMFLFEFISLQHGSISYLCSMFPFYVHATCPYSVPLQHVPIP